MKYEVAILLIGIVFGAPYAMAKNLGTYSRVWSIQEVNIKKIISEQLSHVNTHAIDMKLKKAATNFGSNLKPNKLPNAIHTKTVYFNPSIALKKSIIVRGHVLYKKGTWVNPLKVIRPIKDMLFFNGKNLNQVNFALKALKAHPYKIMLVMTKGNPVKLGNKIHRPVYYATAGLVKRFRIRAVPTLLGVGTGINQYNLAVSTFANPLKIQLIKNCWNGCKSGKEHIDAKF